MPLADDFDDQLTRLHGQGLSLNMIAKQLRCSPSTVSRRAKKLGLPFDRSATKAAVAAHAIDAAARRAKLIDRGYARAEKLYDRLEAPEYRYRVVYKDTSAIETDQQVPANDERALQAAIAGHMTMVARLEQIDAGTQTGRTDSLLDALADGFRDAAGRYTPPPA